MSLSDYIHQEVAKARASTFSNSDQLTLGDIISKCEAAVTKATTQHNGDEPDVVFDFEYIVPVDIDSWRGSYNELAIGFSLEGSGMPLSKFLEILNGAVGKEYTGYKGGDYTMSKETPVWVANYGNSGQTAVIDVVDNGYEVILITALREF